VKPHRFLIVPALALGLLATGAALAQAGTGNLYRVTTKMEVDGMPIQMPSRSIEVCGPKNQASEKMVPADENCTVTDFRVVGNKSTYSMTCRGETPMTATGEFEQLGPDAYRGKMRMRTEGRDAMTMNMSFDGKKIRDCDYATESPEAQGRAMLAKTCTEMLRTPDPGMYQSFTGADAVCAQYKPKYCSAMLGKYVEPGYIRNSDAGLAQMPQGAVSFWDAFAACGLSREAAIKKTCPMAAAKNDYEFLAGYCPDQLAQACSSADPTKAYDFVVSHCPDRARQVAQQQCAGRDFTALRASPYGNFCGRYAAGALRQRNQGAAPANGQPAARPGEQPKDEEKEEKRSWRDRLKSARDLIGG